jgi:Penicillin binding protein transpeptidase domain
MRKGAKAAVVGGVFVVMVGGAGWGAYNILDGLGGSPIGGTAGSDTVEDVKTGPPTADEVKDVTGKFFRAWESGDAVTAASYTNDSVTAGTVFGSYVDDAHITGVHIKPGRAVGDTVPFSVTAKLSYGGVTRPLAYDTELTVVRGETTGRALVDWAPTVVHPKLDPGDTLVTGESAVPPIEAVDRDGKVLTAEKYPSLGPILDTLREKYGAQAGGTSGVELAVHHPTTDLGDTTLLTLKKGKPGRLRTTISASAQAAAETAVKKYAESAVVAVKPSTGAVLAVANNPATGFNVAFQGKLAPGSTMKIITAAMLIDNGVVSMNSPAPCPDTAVWQSQTFHNLQGMKPDENATVARDFMLSCNTGFVKLVDEKPLTDDSLTREAQERFGLGQDNWKTGIASFDGSVPASSGPDRAANAIGQGQVQLNPLNLASVTATAITGAFHQPYLVSKSIDNREFATARGLSPNTVGQLRSMMRLTATQGTAWKAMSGLGGDFGAKTGSAEVDGQDVANAWFTGYHNDMAAAAVAQQGGHGGDTAGPIVAAILRAGS